jgi:formylglycine-generating enzyme required for sulfatase activity
MATAKASPEYAQMGTVDLQAVTIQMSGATTEQLAGTLTTDPLDERTREQTRAQNSTSDVDASVGHKRVLPQNLRRVAAVILAIFLIGGAYGFYHWLRARAARETAARQTMAPAPPTMANMVAIPGGTFMMGRNDVSLESSPFDLNQWPAHPVTVKNFFMDRTEVTNAEYSEFVRETKYNPPSGWTGGAAPAGQEQRPIRDVSFADAQAFAAWRSKRDNTTYRLPTEEEWEYAARNGDQDTLYPWGNEWAEDRANVGTDAIKPVGSYPQGASRWGVLDLIGNVWEWTSSKPSNYPGNNSLKIDPNERDWSTVRGGSYVDIGRGELAITATRRRWIPPLTKNPRLGFRLVRDG